MSSELREKLENYSIQLKKIEELIDSDPTNEDYEDWKKLQTDLLEVIMLTRTLIRKEELKSDDVMLDIRKVKICKNSIQFGAICTLQCLLDWMHRSIYLFIQT